MKTPNFLAIDQIVDVATATEDELMEACARISDIQRPIIDEAVAIVERIVQTDCPWINSAGLLPIFELGRTLIPTFTSMTEDEVHSWWIADAGLDKATMLLDTNHSIGDFHGPALALVGRTYCVFAAALTDPNNEECHWVASGWGEFDDLADEIGGLSTTISLYPTALCPMFRFPATSIFNAIEVTTATAEPTCH